MQNFNRETEPINKNVVKTLLCARQTGSFTVEAAIAVPLFVFFLALFLGLFRVLAVEIRVNEALQYAAGTIAAYSYETEESAAGTALSSLSADVLFFGQLKEEGLESSDVKGGFTGISLGTSESDDLYVVLSAEYAVRLPVAFFGKQYTEVTQYASARKWNGYQEDADGDDTYVYVTKYGTVYHKSTSCSYLDLSVRAVSSDTLDSLRNKNGAIYYACTACDADGASGTVYITDYGTQYHASLNCSRLKRTVYRIALSEAGDRDPCSKCYGD